MHELPIVSRISTYLKNIAITDSKGAYTYGDLLAKSERVASRLLDGQSDLGEARIAFIVPSGFEYVSIMLGIWRAGGIAVPLCVTHPDPELEYVIGDCGAEAVIAAPEFAGRVRKLAHKLDTGFAALEDMHQPGAASLPEIEESRRAMIIYTSGTTSRPKGVVTTHANIRAQIESLVSAWEWVEGDFILNVLPLHHLHGILNALLCALWSGAGCELVPGFDAGDVWSRFIGNDYTLFMAVPTIYSRLIRTWDEAEQAQKKMMSEACRKLRLMVSGSAALPVGTLGKWKDISGHVLLERYGMTELGMVLSNPLHGERLPGRVGKPLPGIEVKLMDENGEYIEGEGVGEIIVRGPNVFLEYWNNAPATEEAFVNGQWFRTGDIAERDRGGVYRILGRSSVDIIKSGGYKVSALEIEEVLREHPDIEECAVVGVPDEEWGERVCAAIVRSGEKEIDIQTLRRWCRERLAPYKIPVRIITVGELPRNRMGKVIKTQVVKLFEKS
jgi:malonyl-CoA/methylmalonyl-CoA synthetase